MKELIITLDCTQDINAEDFFIDLIDNFLGEKYNEIISL